MQFSKEGEIFIQVGHVPVVWSPAFGKYKGRLEANALIGARLQSASRRGQFVAFGKPFLPLLFRGGQVAKLGFRFSYFLDLADGNIQLQYLPEFIAKVQVPKGVSRDERHGLGTQPPPLFQQAFQREMLNEKIVFHYATLQLKTVKHARDFGRSRLLPTPLDVF